MRRSFLTRFGLRGRSTDEGGDAEQELSDDDEWSVWVEQYIESDDL